MVGKTTPPGCVVGVLALLPGGVSAAGVFGLIRWSAWPPADRHFDHVFRTLLGTAGGGLLGAFLLIYLSIRVHCVTDCRRYDPGDSENMKW